MVVLVDVGRWRHTSDQPTVGMVEIVYGNIFLFLRRSHTFLTFDPALNKEDLDLGTWAFSLCLCPIKYGSFYEFSQPFEPAKM